MRSALDSVPFFLQDASRAERLQPNTTTTTTTTEMMTIKTDIRIISAPINYVVNPWKAPPFKVERNDEKTTIEDDDDDTGRKI